MANSGNNLHLIQSRVMEVFMESFKRGFDGKDEYAHEIPNLLKNICQVYCVHNKKKVVTYKKLPKIPFSWMMWMIFWNSLTLLLKRKPKAIFKSWMN
ncbi:hypothetical protein AVEN_12872-1 [Araneus ventricosus]|uniref:Uncharacterized protein n=1 Tax=Araneus ventricosus TaxID=182803 RepID=A0A4Y1ZUY5_ARAVE|nr:hypothetical protein AVEN_12872-1 [Araneus ventricosus]